MKNIFLMTAGVLLAAYAPAQLITYDGFDYTPGTQLRHCTNMNIAGSSAWKYSGSAPNAVVTSGGLFYPGLAASAGNSITNAGNYTPVNDYTYLTNANFTFTTQIFASVIIKVTDLSGLTTNVQPLIALKNASANLVGIRTNSSRPGNFDIGIASNITDLAAQNWATKWDRNDGGGYFTGDSILVVLGTVIEPYNDSKDGRLWVNPPLGTLGGETPWCANIGYGTRFSSSPSPATVYVFGYNGAKVQMDELRVGLTFADVTPTGLVREATTVFTY